MTPNKNTHDICIVRECETLRWYDSLAISLMIDKHIITQFLMHHS